MTNEEIAVMLKDHDKEIGSLKHRMTSCENQQSSLNQLINSVDKLALNMEYMAKEQKEQGERLERLEHEPTDEFKYYKRLVIGCILTGIVGSIVGAVLATIL